MKALFKAAIAIVVVGVLAVLFVRSAQSTRAEPFAVARQDIAGWTLTLTPGGDALGALLSMAPPGAAQVLPLSRDLFSRMGETLHYPSPAIPVILQSEYDRAMAGALEPQALLDAARVAGLESTELQPRCVARRRNSAPGVVEGVYFVLFDFPQFTRFREQVAQQLGVAPSLFDPGALSPVLIAADLDGRFRRWLPLSAVPDADCFAPVIVE